MAESAGPNDQGCCLPWLALVTKHYRRSQGHLAAGPGQRWAGLGLLASGQGHPEALSDPCRTPHSQLSHAMVLEPTLARARSMSWRALTTPHKVHDGGLLPIGVRAMHHRTRYSLLWLLVLTIQSSHGSEMHPPKGPACWPS